MNKNLKYLALLLIIFSSSCKEKKLEKTYLANFIDSVKIKNSITENPLLIIDGYNVEYETMNDGWFLIKEEDVSNINYLKKELGEKIYGSKGKNGVVLLTTKLQERQTANKGSDKKILYVLDGEIITFEDYKEINQNKIIGTATITDNNAIREFTSKDYDEIIYVTTKMPTN